MSPPYCSGPHDGEVPESNEPLGITSRQPFIVSNKRSHMDLGFVSSQDILG